MIKKILNQHFDYNNQSIVEIRTVKASDKPKESAENYHYHNFCQIVAVHSGNIEFIVNSIPIVIDNKSVLMFGNELPHGVVNVSKGAKVTIIHIPYDVLSWMNKIVELENVSQFIKDSKSGFLFTSDCINKKTLLLSRRLRLSTGFQRISYLFEMLDLLSKDSTRRNLLSGSNISNNNYAFKQSSIEKVVNYLYKHYEEEIELDKLSQVASQNASSLCRSFKKSMGSTISQFVNRLRIEKACQLLLNNDLTISQVAYMVGYNTFSHFSSQFLQIVGTSPSEYKKKILKL